MFNSYFANKCRCLEISFVLIPTVQCNIALIHDIYHYHCPYGSKDFQL